MSLLSSDQDEPDTNEPELKRRRGNPAGVKVKRVEDARRAEKGEEVDLDDAADAVDECFVLGRWPDARRGRVGKGSQELEIRN